MNSKTTITYVVPENPTVVSVESHSVAVFEPGDLTEIPGGVNEFWMDLRRRELTVTSTLAHILNDSHSAHDPRPRR